MEDKVKKLESMFLEESYKCVRVSKNDCAQDKGLEKRILVNDTQTQPSPPHPPKKPQN